MRILLTEGSGLTSRQVAGRLHAAGHRVGVLSSDPLFLARFTNATSTWHRVPPFGSDPLGWLDAALGVYHEHGYDVLFPTQEQVAVLSASSERLRTDGVATMIPPFDALSAVLDKASATATIARLGLPQPETTVLRDHRALDAFDTFPAFVKLPIGTASAGVGLVRTVEEMHSLVDSWNVDEAFAVGGVVAQSPASGPLAMVQSVFDDGTMTAFHANLRTREGARGGASHKRSVAAPEARSVIERLGGGLGWHGALSADVILTDHGPELIDINPRLVEPNNAWCSGVDLVGAMLGLPGLPGLPGGERPATAPVGTAGVATHQFLLAVLGAAEHDGKRRAIIGELRDACLRRGSYRDSQEELTPLRHDPLTALPVVVATAATLARPRSWTWFSSGSVSSYALSPNGWRMILNHRVDDKV